MPTNSRTHFLRIEVVIEEVLYSDGSQLLPHFLAQRLRIICIMEVKGTFSHANDLQGFGGDGGGDEESEEGPDPGERVETGIAEGGMGVEEEKEG